AAPPPSSATAADAATNAARTIRKAGFIDGLLSHGDTCRPDHIVVVPGRIEDQRVHLRLTEPIGGSGEDRARPRRVGGEAVAPGTKCETAKIIAQSGFPPGRAIVGRNRNRTDSIAAIPGEPRDIEDVAHARQRSLRR